MIGGMVEHDGRPALAIHLGKLGDNETVAIRTHGLSADTIADAIAELRLMALGCRSKKPLLHSWASPSRTCSEADWEHHRAALEVEFGLEGHPCIEVFHLKRGKGGRTAGHVHRVYLRVDIDGKAVRTSHSAIRMEKVSRIAEHEAGERFTSGCFNRAVIARLRAEGRHDIADAMVRAGLDKTEARAAPSATERAMTERLHDLAADEVWRRAATAWRRSDNGAAFVAALAESGLRLAQGEKCPVLVSPGGAVHPLLRAINTGGERQRGQAIRKGDLEAKLDGMVLPAVADLDPVVDFDAGAFAITNLDRLPAAAMTKTLETTDIGKEAPLSPDQFRPLTLEQEAVLLELEAAFHSAAADRARATRDAIEAEVVKQVAQRRLAVEKAAWDLPGIGKSGWRDAYRAELAGLPRQYGPYLKWVDRLDAERSRVVLKSGATVTLAPNRAWIEKSNGGDAIAVMIAHARERGWREVTITGNVQWRHDMARAATRAGLTVDDADLVPVVRAETTRMEQEEILQIWWRCRQALIDAHPGERSAARTALLDILERIAARPDIVGRVSDKGQRHDLAADLDAYGRHRRKAGINDPRPPETRAPPGPG